MSADTRQKVRIFISSPSDVRPERLIADKVIHRLAREFSFHLDVTPVMWEREPLLASAHFQEMILPPHETDIVVAILWSRLGTPLPESRFRGPISGRTVTGTEWEFEDALASYRDKQLPDLLLYRKEAEIPAILSNRAEIEERLQQKELLDDFLSRWTRDATGKSFTAASWPFSDGAEFEAMLEEHLRRLLQRRLLAGSDTEGFSPPTIRWHQGSPYRGLETFQREHEQIFFGRTRARNELRELLARRIEKGIAFVVVVGASGAGKSSLVQAGLVPDVCTAGMIGRVGLVRVAVTRPGAGSDLLDGLASAVLEPSALPELSSESLQYNPERLASLFRQAPAQVVQTMRQGLAGAGRKAGLTDIAEPRLLLIVDQLEELFTGQTINEDDRAAYVAILEALARSGLVWVVATLRTDFFPRLDEVPALANLAQGEARYFLSMPDAAERGQIVRQPAREAGLRFEIETSTGRGLDDEILEAASDSASLPLLEYLLDQLWSGKTNNGELTYAAYRALGGLEGAIGARAETVLLAQPPEVQAAFPRLLRALVTVGQGVRSAATARYADIAQFPARSPELRLIEALRDKSARLLVSDRNSLRVTHEALLTHWPRAREQIAEDRADLQLRARLEDAAARWRSADEANRLSLLLSPGLPLSEAEDYLERRGTEIDGEIASFIRASVAAEADRQQALREAEQSALRDRLRRSRRFAIAVTLLLVLVAGAGTYAWHLRGIAAIKRAEAENSYTLALTQAAGSAQRLREGYGAGAVSNRLFSDLVTMSRRTVEGLPGEAADITAARAQLLEVLSRANADLGDFDEGRLLAQKALALADDLHKRSPNDPQARLLQSQAHGALSEVLFRAGDPRAAADHARAAIDQLKPLLSANLPADSLQLARHEYMDNHERLGVALVNVGRLDDAVALQKSWVSVAQELVAKEPAALVWLRTLGAAYEDLGDTLQALGRLRESAEAYRGASVIASRLIEAAPDNKDYLFLICASGLRMGDILLQEGDPQGAVAQYRATLDTANLVMDRDPSIYRFRQMHAIAHQRIGDVHLVGRHHDDALQYFSRYLELTVETFRRLPGSSSAFFDVANAHQKIGDAFRAAGRWDEALSAYREALSRADDLTKRKATSSQWHKSLANDYYRIGLTFEAKGNSTDALEAYRKCAAVAVNRFVWSPRERWPLDVHEECSARIEHINKNPPR